MNAVIDALSAMAAWLLGIFEKIFLSGWDLVLDVFVEVADMFLIALAALIVSIPAPAFLSSYSLNSLFSGFTSDILFFVSAFRIPEGIGMLGAAFGVRMARKILTLFQW